MTGADLKKLQDAGFRVFYWDEDHLLIWEAKYGCRVKFGGPYKTGAELRRAWNELMKDPKHISR